MHTQLDIAHVFPHDYRRAVLVGRLWVPGEGPVLVHVRDDVVLRIDMLARTCSELLELQNPAKLVRRAPVDAVLARTPDVLNNSAEPGRTPNAPYFMAPCDLQAIKAARETFVGAVIDHALHHLAKGDAAEATRRRALLNDAVGGNVSRVIPASPTAQTVIDTLRDWGATLPIVHAALGPNANIITQAQPMSAVGVGAEVGIHPRSQSNHAEPEMVLAVDSAGQVKGATLGSSMTAHDFDHGNPLLAARSQDNNASCAIGPFIRLFDDDFTLQDIRHAELSLHVSGRGMDTDPDAPFELTAVSSMAAISRDPIDLVRLTCGDNHQYPDGLMLFLGSAFYPTLDRRGQGMGFAQRVGDVVRVSAPQLGSLVNRVARSDQIAPWTYGATALLQDLLRRA